MLRDIGVQVCLQCGEVEPEAFWSETTPLQDGIVNSAFDPRTGQQTLTVAISGKRMSELAKNRSRAVTVVENVMKTLTEPQAVWETEDGGWIFVHELEGLAATPKTSKPPALAFAVFVRPTGLRVSVWRFVDIGPDDPLKPLPEKEFGLRRRLK